MSKYESFPEITAHFTDAQIDTNVDRVIAAKEPVEYVPLTKEQATRIFQSFKVDHTDVSDVGELARIVGMDSARVIEVIKWMRSIRAVRVAELAVEVDP